jgi:hypothetical protein
MANNIVKHRRGTTQEWEQVDLLVSQMPIEEAKAKRLIPENGELVIEELEGGIRKCKIGDGETRFTDLPNIAEPAAEELGVKLDDLQKRVTADLANAVAALDQKILTTDTELSERIESLDVGFTSQMSNLKFTVKELTTKLDEIDSLVYDGIKTEIADLPARYEGALSTLAEQHAEDKVTLENTIAVNAAKLAEDIEQVAAGAKSDLTVVKSELVDDYTNKIEAVEANLQEAIAEVDTATQQQAIEIGTIQESILELQTSIDEFTLDVDTRLTTVEESADESIQEIRETINKLGLTVEQIQNELEAKNEEILPDFNVGQSNVEEVLPVIVEQLEDLRYKVTTLESGGKVNTTEIQGIAAELAHLTSSVTSVIKQHSTDAETTSKVIKALDEKLSKADSDIIATVAQANKEVTEGLSALSAADTLLYQTLYKIKDDLIKKIEAVDAYLQAELDEDISIINQSVNDTKLKLDAKLASVQSGTIEGLANLKAELLKKLDNIAKLLDTKIEANESSIGVLSSTVVANQKALSDSISSVASDVIANKAGIADNNLAIGQLNTLVEANKQLIDTNLTALGARLDTQIAGVESRLQAAIDTTDSITKQQAESISSIQDRITDLDQGIDRRIVDKVTQGTESLNTSVIEIREAIAQINLTLELLKNNTGTSTNPGSGTEANLLILVEQIAVLQRGVSALERKGATMDAELTQINTELSGLAARLTAEVGRISSNLDSLGVQLIKADSEINDLIVKHVSSLNTELADQAADDVLLYQIIYRIRDELIALVDLTAGDIRDELSAYQDDVSQNFETAEAAFTTKLTNEKTYLDNKINDLAARVEKETNALYVTHNSKIAENKTAIANLASIVANNKNEAKQELAATNERLAKTVERVSSNQNTLSKVDKDLKDNVNLINLNIDTLTKNIAAQDARISSLMALEPGSTTGDAAYDDICNGYDGTVHKTPGDAVRAVGNDLLALGNNVKTLEDSLSQYIGSQAVDGLHYDINGDVGLGQPYMLYLKAGDEILQDSGVQVIGGSGGSGGGGGASKLKISYLQGESSEVKVVAGTKTTIGFIFEGEDSSGDTIFSASATWRIDGVIVERSTVKYGENYFDATKYIKTGTTKVHLTVNDDNGGTVTKSWTVQSIELKLASDFNDKRKYSIDDRVIFSFVPTGAITKTAIFKLDGVELPSKEIGKDISGTPVSYELPPQPHGAHLLEVYLEAEINNTAVKTDPPIYKDIIWYDSTSTTPVIGTSVKTLEVKQYATTNIVYTVYDPKNDIPTVSIEVDGTIVSTQTVGPNKDYSDTPTAVYPYVATIPGDHVIKLICGTTEKVINIYAESINVNISPVTTGLAFDFNPVGRNNNDANRLWSHGNIKMTVSENFDWVNGGYIPDEADGPCFCIKAGSTAAIDYKLFLNEAKVSGKEFKLIFKTKNVANPDAVFLSCLDNTTARDHVGVKMGIHNATIYGKDVSLDLAYSEDDVIEFEFNISSDAEAIPMIMGYEDGVPSRPMVYNTKTSSFQQNSAKVITLGSPDCDLYIYRCKVYETSLSASEILRNFIADARTTDEMINRYNRNQIYDENQNLTAETLAEKCPWLRIYKISAPHFTNNKSDKVKNTTIQQIYLDGDPKLDNWVCYNAQHSGQGTSSNNYGAAGRNLDFIMNKSDAYFILGDGSRPDDNKITLTRSSVPVAYLNAKVNIASSNNLTNAILANRYNKYNPYERPFVESQLISTGEKDANGNEIKIKPKDTMEMHNCVIFIQETDQDLTTHREFADTDWHFYAIGNIGDSKKTDDTRLTDPEDPYECCVEIMDVGLPLSGFPRETIRNAMAVDLDDQNNKVYKWATAKNLEKGILLEKQEDGSYVVTSDTELPVDENGDITKTYYIDFLEHDDFSEDYTYGWRYISDDENPEIVDTCKQAWIDFYRFVTTSSDEDFKANLKDYFIVDSALYYYLFTTRYCMVDNRAKNTFWHYGKAADGTRKWDLCWDYDNDTSLGLNNFGKQLYRYGLEDIDADEAGKEVFRQSDSLFFCRIRDLFGAELKEMFKTLESADAWNASAFLNQCDTWQEQFPEELWRVDIERKYIRTYKTSFINGSGDKQFLTNMCNGRMKYHRRQWERSQELYMASKYQTPTALGDKYHANFRAAQFKKEELENLAIPTNYQFTLTPYAYMYLNVYYNSGSPFSVRITDANINTPVTVPYPRDEADIMNIGSASAIRDFGDLAPIYADTVSVANAARIKQLKLGDDAIGYDNKALSSFTVVDENGNGAQQLEKLILTNISGLKTSQDFEALVNLKELYAFGTSIPSVTFAPGGKLEYAELPAVTILNLRSLKYLTDAGLKLTGVANDDGTIAYTSIVDLTIEDCPHITALNLFEACPNVVNVKLDNIHFGTKTYKYFEDNIFKLKGFEGEHSNAKLTGSVHFESLNGEQFNEIRRRYPNLTITYDALTSVIKFMDTDKTTARVTEEYTRDTENKINCIDLGIVPSTVSEKTASDEFSYELFGWSTNPDEPAVNYEHLEEGAGILAEENDRRKYNENMLTNLAGDYVFYPVFKAIRRSYVVKFIGADAEVLKDLSIPYGSIVSEAEYADLCREDTSEYDAPGINVFIGWLPKPEDTMIVGDTIFSAQFVEDELGLADIEYTLTGSSLTITNCVNRFNDAVRVPNVYKKDGKDYAVTGIGGFSGYTDLTLIKLPDTLVSFGTNAFHECINLREIAIPNRVSELAQDAFSRCYELTKVDLQGNIEILGATCFSWCYKLTDINLKEGLTEIRSFALNQCALTDVVIPSTVSTIGDTAFGKMSSLKTVTFKEYLQDDGTIRLPSIHANAFTGDVITFNVPWSRAEHIAKYGESTFGANVEFEEAFNFNYKEETK